MHQIISNRLAMLATLMAITTLTAMTTWPMPCHGAVGEDDDGALGEQSSVASLQHSVPSPPYSTLRPQVSGLRSPSSVLKPPSSDSGPPWKVVDTDHPATLIGDDIDSVGGDDRRENAQLPLNGRWPIDFEALIAPDRIGSTLQFILALSIISLAPAALLMTTSFVRLVVVLGILRQAIGLQQLPPAQVTTALALMMTILVMAPIWSEVKREALDPYTDPRIEMSWEEAWQSGVEPLKQFMSRQIDRADNGDTVWLFYRYLPESERGAIPQTYADVPLRVLVPAFMISELKVAFLIGFQICLPFLVLDLVVASVSMSMGMVTLPPTTISLPLKLLLFVMVDGWTLVVAMMMDSFTPYLM